nr:hypothetical protein [Pectobacterium aquaticum]
MEWKTKTAGCVAAAVIALAGYNYKRAQFGLIPRSSREIKKEAVISG